MALAKAYPHISITVQDLSQIEEAKKVSYQVIV